MKCDIKQVQAQSLTDLSWDQVDRIMERTVARGLDRRSPQDLSYLGIDEKSFGKGHDYSGTIGTPMPPGSSSTAGTPP